MGADDTIQNTQSLSDSAISAAKACIWEWKPDDEVLRIRAVGNSVIPEIEGDWSLGSFAEVLSDDCGSAIGGVLSSATRRDRFSLNLSLRTGEDVRLIGSQMDDGHARGLIFADEASTDIPDTSELEAVFQPIMRLRDGTIAGFEALARWRCEDGELRRAGDMALGSDPLADSGLALKMLDQASDALANWRETFSQLNLFVQVNLTGADLFRADVMSKVESLVQSGRFPKNALRIELTEQMALTDFDAAVAAAAALQASGAALVLDDFGSGHSSLAWLAAIPAVGIKFDPDLTKLAGRPRTDTILSGISRIARSLGMSITAEGIEDFRHVQFLRGIGCDYVQGFAYARPMNFETAQRFLSSQVRLSELTR
ncbi:MAG: diguanylate phosphodiesterase [Ponticaulis sp.]|nr:diguanylate phosphodiesterase [Ponticaulis sp.]|tara:strand:- start:17116 stop:18225 length:1110 start_codon:yes stop_codon:yes gene_type:complete